MAMLPPIVNPPAPIVEATVVEVALNVPNVGDDVETRTPLALTAVSELIGRDDSVVLPETVSAVSVPTDVSEELTMVEPSVVPERTVVPLICRAVVALIVGATKDVPK